MTFIIELLLIGVGLSMDAFAVSVCKGLAMRRVNKKQALVIGFGGFQALMPFIGWALGTQFESYITNIDHWIAFILLALIGGKMVVEGFRLEEDETVKELDPPLDLKEMFLLAIATSIDALAVGLSDRGIHYDHWTNNLCPIHCRCCCREYVRKQISEKSRDRRRYYFNPHRFENSARTLGNSCIIKKRGEKHGDFKVSSYFSDRICIAHQGSRLFRRGKFLRGEKV